MRVEVAYARPRTQVVIPLEVPSGTTALEAIRRSGVLVFFPEIDLECSAIGVFGRPVAAAQALDPGDRVEIYRPLRADPREVRRLRARGGRRSGSG